MPDDAEQFCSIIDQHTWSLSKAGSTSNSAEPGWACCWNPKGIAAMLKGLMTEHADNYGTHSTRKGEGER